MCQKQTTSDISTGKEKKKIVFAKGKQRRWPYRVRTDIPGPHCNSVPFFDFKSRSSTSYGLAYSSFFCLLQKRRTLTIHSRNKDN